MSSAIDTEQSKSSSKSSTVLVASAVAVVAISLALFTPARSLLSKYITPFASRRTAVNMTTVLNGNTNGSVFGPARPPPPLKIAKRPWNARGHADHGWLYTFHTFSFASYYDPSYESFGPLRVINEDRVERGTGFGTHSHAEFLIWSYIVSGELEHKDSMGNLEKLRRGEVQFTSAGTGIRHSEYCRNEEEDVHFLQIWARPNVRGLKPSYKTQKYTDEQKQDKLCRIMESTDRHGGSDEQGQPIPLHADLTMDASILSPGKKVVHEVVKPESRNIYLHLVMNGREQPKSGGAMVKVGNQTLGEGDGAFVLAPRGTDKIEIESVGEKPAEFLLFDMGQ